MQAKIIFTKFDTEKAPKESFEKFFQVAKEVILKEYPTLSNLQISVGTSSEAYVNVAIKIEGMTKNVANILHNDMIRKNLLPHLNAFEKICGEPLSESKNIYIDFFDSENENTKNNSSIKNDKSDEDSEFDYKKLSKMFSAVEPTKTFDRVILNDETRNLIEDAIVSVKISDTVFSQDGWGLSATTSPSVALNFYGPSGTGKTMCAEALANHLGKKIIIATYADIESKFHGEGPKMVKAIFLAAEQQDAVLFIDEADSLLSKRLTNVTQGSEQAINSMRSQLLTSIESYKGIVIFASNLIQNYDPAFLTRLICIKLDLPDCDGREKIWHCHLHSSEEMKASGKELHIPLADDVDIRALAEQYEFCGRTIRDAVKWGCINAKREMCEGKQEDKVYQHNLIYGCDRAVKLRSLIDGSLNESSEIIVEELTEKEQQDLSAKVLKKVIEQKETENNIN